MTLRRLIVGMLVVAVLLYAALCVALTAMQRSFIYFPESAMGVPAQYGLAGYEVGSARTEDGLDLTVWHRPAGPDRPTIIVFHGNAGHLGYRAGLLTALAAADLGVVALEYRGYGGNPGSPSQDGLYRDGWAALAFAEADGVPPNRIVLYGESLGTGVAVQMATECGCAALALQSPYTSCPMSPPTTCRSSPFTC